MTLIALKLQEPMNLHRQGLGFYLCIRQVGGPTVTKVEAQLFFVNGSLSHILEISKLTCMFTPIKTEDVPFMCKNCTKDHQTHGYANFRHNRKVMFEKRKVERKICVKSAKFQAHSVTTLTLDEDTEADRHSSFCPLTVWAIRGSSMTASDPKLRHDYNKLLN